MSGTWGAVLGGVSGFLVAWIYEAIEDNRFREKPRRAVLWAVIAIGSLVLIAPCVFLIFIAVMAWIESWIGI